MGLSPRRRGVLRQSHFPPTSDKGQAEIVNRRANTEVGSSLWGPEPPFFYSQENQTPL